MFKVGQPVQYRYGTDWLNATVVKVGKRITIDLENFTNPHYGPVEWYVSRIAVKPDSLHHA